MRVSNPRKRLLYWAVILIWVLICFLSGSLAIVHAQVGDPEICVDTLGSSTHSQNLTNTVEGAQTFTTVSGIVVTGVKIPVTRSGSVDTLQVEIWPVDGSGRPNQPGGVLGTESVSFNLPQSTGSSTDQRLQCNTTENPEQVIEFDPPVSLSGSTMYAIVGWSTSTVDLEWNYSFNDPPVTGGVNYSGGLFWNNEASFDRNDPTKWVESGGTRDSGFTVFGNIFTSVETDIDSWLENFLASLGLNSDMGKLLSGVLFVGTLMFALLNRGVVALMAMAVSAMAGTFLVAAMIFDPSILLIMVAIVGLGAMGLIFALFSGAGDSADG